MTTRVARRSAQVAAESQMRLEGNMMPAAHPQHPRPPAACMVPSCVPKRAPSRGGSLLATIPIALRVRRLAYAGAAFTAHKS
eukprot:CAMPEP_0181231604 /NCGR_PEP_ID=MMETSP1096-20121128/35213_1 /TAXON_ID=156174 ORGANISM="Chrysochromulina ericina, Strain CCMP281" /NCGR_SAMPLE_ID=MMETSP1096 /ASSEMBLY_ACC=CAM_ASM_000453 /LENGTH=81 /DNA_ID=CAMNT_0023325693 /DNA_START=57 /DNA_END=302 /DNA_ORIENTATION=+